MTHCLALEAHPLHVGTRMLLTVRVRRQIRHAQIDVKEIVGINRRLTVELDSSHQKPLTAQNSCENLYLSLPPIPCIRSS